MRYEKADMRPDLVRLWINEKQSIDYELRTGNGIPKLVERLGVARKALKAIYDPITALRVEAEKEGKQLDGMAAIRLSECHGYLKDLAKNALDNGVGW